MRPPPRACTPSSRSASARAAWPPAGSQATRSNWAWCRSARSAWASSVCCSSRRPPSTRWRPLVLVALGFGGGPVRRAPQRPPAAAALGTTNAAACSPPTTWPTRSACCSRPRVMWTLGAIVGLSLERVILIAGAFTLAATIYVVLTLPDFFIRFTLWLLTHTIYRIRIVGQPNIPLRGPALAHRQPRVARRWRARRRLHPAFRAFHGLRADLPEARAELAVPADVRDPGVGRQQDARSSTRSPGPARNWRPDTWCASSPRARSAGPATCCRSSAASSRSSRASTCRSCRSTSIACGAASSASRTRSSSGSGPSACRTR